jgi:hypothetical protein
MKKAADTSQISPRYRLREDISLPTVAAAAAVAVEAEEGKGMTL